MATAYNIYIDDGRVRRPNGYLDLPIGITGPASYVTGGDAVDASAFRMGTIIFIPVTVLTNGSGGTLAVIASYNYTSKKMQMWYADVTPGAPLVEVANATNLSTYTGRTTVRGK